MRLSSLFIVVGTFLAAAAVSFIAAYFSVRLVEESSIAGVESRLADDGVTWASVDANGLQVFVIGTAPTEAERFRALSLAGTVVDAARVIDELQVADSAALEAPDFSIEILRNDEKISLIGLVPTNYEIDNFIKIVTDIAGGENNVSNLLEMANFPTPDGWDRAIRFSTRALEELPRSKISINAEVVAVKAMTDSAAAKDRIEGLLTRTAPEEISLELDLEAPRPVVTPFVLRFTKTADTTGFDSCTANTEAARDQILAAAKAAGLEGDATCQIALGSPSKEWGKATSAAIKAVGDLGGGEVTFTNADIALLALEGTEASLFDTVVGKLENALPEAFVLDAVLPETPDPEQDQGPIEFVATRSPEGTVQLRGRINSETARSTAENYARARFTSSDVTVGTRVDPDLPANWSSRVLAGLEVLSMLANGSIVVTPEQMQVTGDTGDQNAEANIAGVLADKLGADSFVLNLTYKEKLDPTLGIPTPEECVAQITTIIGDRKITFEPGSATLDLSAKDILDELAELLTLCGDIPLEIQGHTDSQGRELMNEQLSQERAQSVLNALRDRRVFTSSYRAKGYGEVNPIATNDTEEGREANRRIEFRLIEQESTENADETVEEGASDQAEGVTATDAGEGSDSEQN